MKDVESKLSSKELAELIIHGLLSSGLIKGEDFDESVKIVEEEINARKAVRDYWCSSCPNLD